ncbi:hypothetical protein NIES2098_43340 [Calothrix sp. NIES-2098]|nr:hypothetical protein NIES2098_43340 [Calothrix sp. NIES-2098]
MNYRFFVLFPDKASILFDEYWLICSQQYTTYVLTTKLIYHYTLDFYLKLV